MTAQDPAGAPLRPGPLLLGLTQQSPPGRAFTLLLLVTTLLLTVVVALVHRSPVLPFADRDNQHYFCITERVTGGVPQHESAFDPKNTLPLLVTAAVIRLGDVVGMPVVASSRVGSILSLALLVWAVAMVGLRLSGNQRVAWLAAFAMLSFASLGYSAAQGGQPKLLIVVFMVLTLLAVADQRWVLAAFWGSLSFLSWQPTLIMLGGVLLTAVMFPEGRRRLGWMAVATVVPVLLYEAYFWSHGVLAEQLFQSFTYPATYMTHSFQGVLRALRGLMGMWEKGFGLSNIVPLVFGATALAQMGAIARRPAETVAGLRANPGWICFLITMIGVLTFTLYDHQGPPDLYLTLPYVALVAAIGTTALIERLSADPPAFRLAATGLVILGLAGLAAHGPAFNTRVHYTLADQLRLSEEVHAYLSSGEEIYAVNCGHLLAFNRSSNWIRYSSFFRGVNKYLRARSGANDAWVPLRDGRLPSLILQGGGRPYGWPGWLSTRYDEITPESFRKQGISVWKLRQASVAGPS